VVKVELCFKPAFVQCEKGRDCYCPDSEVRIIVPQPRLRTSESKDFAKALHEIVKLFYSEMHGKDWEAFGELVKVPYGENDPFSKVLQRAAPFLRMVRDTRDCLDHGNLKGVKTLDFEPQPDGTIMLASIEIDFRKSNHKRCEASRFMEEVARGLLDCFEMIVVHTCSKNMQPFAGMPMTVGLVDENYRKAWYARFAYGAYYENGQFVPCG
jgi:hypothetical protein